MRCKPWVWLWTAGCCALVGAGASGTTYVWSGGGSGGVFGSGTAWDSAANWVLSDGSPAGDYPRTSADVALINRSGTPYYSTTAYP